MNIEEIENAVRDDLIDYEEAYGWIKELPKPWHRKDWKLTREKKLGKECIKCGSTKDLLIQHNHHPEKFKTIQTRTFNKLYGEQVDEIRMKTEPNIIGALDEYLVPEPREACPNCGSVSIRKRKTISPPMVCGKGHMFEQPIEIKYYVKCQTSNLQRARQVALDKLTSIHFSPLYRGLVRKTRLEIGRLAILESIAQHKRYMEMRDEEINTYCKSCAYREDILGGTSSTRQT